MDYSFTNYITFLCRKIRIFTFVVRKYAIAVSYLVFVIVKRGKVWYRRGHSFDGDFLQLIGNYHTNFNAISVIINRYSSLKIGLFATLKRFLNVLNWRTIKTKKEIEGKPESGLTENIRADLTEPESIG